MPKVIDLTTYGPLTTNSGIVSLSTNDWSTAIGPVEPELDYDTIFERIAEKFNKVPTIEHKCHNCGGTLEIKANDGIFKCPYCKSCYAIGTSKINWRY